MAAAICNNKQLDYGLQPVTVIRQCDGWSAKEISPQLNPQQPQSIDALLALLEQRGIVRMTIEL